MVAVSHDYFYNSYGNGFPELSKSLRFESELPEERFSNEANSGDIVSSLLSCFCFFGTYFVSFERESYSELSSILPMYLSGRLWSQFHLYKDLPVESLARW